MKSVNTSEMRKINGGSLNYYKCKECGRKRFTVLGALAHQMFSHNRRLISGSLEYIESVTVIA